MQTDEFVTVTVDCSGDPDASKLQALFDADRAYDRARRARDRWCFALALLCAAIWLGTTVSDEFPVAPAAIALVLVAARTVGAILIERHRHRRWTNAVHTHPGVFLTTDERQ